MRSVNVFFQNPDGRPSSLRTVSVEVEGDLRAGEYVRWRGTSLYRDYNGNHVIVSIVGRDVTIRPSPIVQEAADLLNGSRPGIYHPLSAGIREWFFGVMFGFVGVTLVNAWWLSCVTACALAFAGHCLFCIRRGYQYEYRYLLRRAEEALHATRVARPHVSGMSVLDRLVAIPPAPTPAVSEETYKARFERLAARVKSASKEVWDRYERDEEDEEDEGIEESDRFLDI